MTPLSVWDAYASAYDVLPRVLPSYGRMLHRVCNAVAGSTAQGGGILDVGCGTGNYAIALASQGYRVTAVDGSSAMLKRARRKAAAQAQDVAFMKADLTTRLPFESGAFDAVLSIMVLYAIPDAVALLSELRRVVKPGGCLALATTDDRDLVLPAVDEVIHERGLMRGVAGVTALIGVGLLNAIIESRIAHGAYRGYDESTIAAVMSDAGWTIKSIERCYVADAGILVLAVAPA